MNQSIWIKLTTCVVALVALGGCASVSPTLSPATPTNSPPAAPALPTALSTSLPSRPTKSDKLSARLEMLASSSTLRAANADEQARALSLPPQGPGSLIRDAQGRILVNIRSTDLSANGLQALRDAGANIVNVAEAYQQVTAFVAIADLAAIGNLPSVVNVQEQLAPANTGGVIIPNSP